MKKKWTIIMIACAVRLTACAKGEKTPDAQSTDMPVPTAEATAQTEQPTVPEETVSPVTETPAPETAEIAIPEDPRGSDLKLKAEEWGGYACLFPETFSIAQTSADAIDASAPDGQQTGLVELAYAKTDVISSLPHWYLDVQETVHDPAVAGANTDDFEIDWGHEIMAGFHGVYLRHRMEGYTICLSALYNAEDVLIIRGKARSEDGVTDFDSIVRRFAALDARRTAAGMGEGINPYFTCTGTEYGRFPIIPPEQRKAEALAFLNENRDALERAASVALDTGEMTEIGYQLYHLSGTGLRAKLCDPDPVFAEDAGKYLALRYPRAIDTTYDDPGILYEFALIYTNNTAEQISEDYRHDLEPIGGNWFIEMYFYAY